MTTSRIGIFKYAKYRYCICTHALVYMHGGTFNIKVNKLCVLVLYTYIYVAIKKIASTYMIMMNI